MFLCSEFCSPDVALNKIDQWGNWFDEQVAAGRGAQFQYTSGMGPMYSMNLQMNIIKRQRNLSIDEMNAFLALKLGPVMADGGNRPPKLQLEMMPVSDWTPKHTDVLTVIPVLSRSLALTNPVREKAVLEILREELLVQPND